MRRICLVAACAALLTILPASVARAECSPVPPVGCPASPTPSPSPTPTPTSSPPKQNSQNGTADQTNSVELERQFFDLVNQERSKRGLTRLAYNASLTSVARRHSARMAESGRLYHNTSELQSAEFNRRMGNPEMVGENVGEGPSVQWLHEAFMDSPGHRSNVLEPRYTSLGVGVAVKDGTIWVTQNYIRGGTAKVRGGFPRSVRPSRPATRVLSRPPARQVFPAAVAPPVVPARAPKPVMPRISSLKLPPIPAPILPPDGEPGRRPLLPLAVLATLSAVAFASRRDAGAWI